eukprot:CAMPEP_0172498432 /NCGR_PEP_ID=MMETSP1066-20121228/113428_1 /TAXON_ID=671091 /ORGANISM="Coscinodiscus wailesii, Strain CCMP2513" /LENGTH=298 /DNA_ID=CAMNT_0013271709 /DNA_START=61 /DNA_END=957 /DNA_ORIENTATION=+
MERQAIMKLSFIFTMVLSPIPATSFLHNTPLNKITLRPTPTTQSPHILSSNFFSDILRDAFANDSNLSKDKTQDQLEYGDGSSAPVANAPTAVQKRWLESTQKKPASRVEAPINSELLTDTKWNLKLYLAGVPDRDPSNNLYGSRVNISSRDRSLELGVTCPEEPSVEVDVELLDGGVCRIGESAFTTSEPGEFIVSPDNQYLRISIPTTGYQRIVKTTGSITKVFWSEENEAVTKTSSTYSIPAGVVYAEVKMGYGLPGEIVMSDGVLRFEKRVGLAGYKMVNCGRVEGSMVLGEEE